MEVGVEHKVFKFRTPSGTSRGVLSEKQAWFISISENNKTGIGECSIIPGLSPDFENENQYKNLLAEFTASIAKVAFHPFYHLKEFELLTTVKEQSAIYKNFGHFPSLIFGFETALLNWSSGHRHLFFDTPFTQGKDIIAINGLVWMGNSAFMRQQMQEKVNQGFNCIKMKVGAIDFQAELEILAEFRKKHSPKDMILRVDANGAFESKDVRKKLRALAQFDIHSIEQPIATGQYQLMADLCAENILPIALDEELIAVHDREEKIKLLDKIKPQYIILKPSLHGGILSCREWIQLAQERKIDWWLTSALESNLGLECITQFTSTYPVKKHHGLGTGSLYIKNEESKLKVANGFISY